MAVLVIGGSVGAWIGRPWETPIDYNKRIVREGQRKLRGETWFSSVEELYSKIVKRSLSRPLSTEMSEEQLHAVLKKVDRAQRALVDLGYLTEMNFAVSNQSAGIVIQRVSKSARQTLSKDRIEFSDICHGTNNTVDVLCLNGDQAKWEELVRKADAE